MKIHLKLLIYILTSTVIINLIVGGYITYQTGKNSIAEAYIQAHTESEKYAQVVTGELNQRIAQLESVALSESNYLVSAPTFQKEHQQKYLYDILINNPQVQAVSLLWELSAIDSAYLAPYGYILTCYYRDVSKRIAKTTASYDMEGDAMNSSYYQMKSKNEIVLTNPQLVQYSFGNRKLTSTIGVPIMYKGHFMGAAQMDLSAENLNEIVRYIHPFKNSYAFLVSHDGTIVSHPSDTVVGRNIAEIYPTESIKYGLIDNLRNGKPSTFNRVESEQTLYFSFAPVQIRGVNTPWSLCIAIPRSVILTRPLQQLYNAGMVYALGLILMGVLIYIITNLSTRPLRQINESMVHLANGEVEKVLTLSSSNNLEIMQINQAIVQIAGSLRRKIDFADQLRLGNYTHPFSPDSERDALSNALIELRKNLKEAHEDDVQRKNFDEKLNWASIGYSDFNNLISKHQHDFEKFMVETIVWLTKYVGMAVGGMYLVESNEKMEWLRLYASYNYNKENKPKRKISTSEGLLGRCLTENEPLYQTRLPSDYMYISSGLGEHKAEVLLLVPLTINRKAYGVVEMASFHEVESYKIDFLKKIGENIAAIVMNIRANDINTKLLEKQKIQAQEMTEKDAKKQQNLEEIEVLYQNAIREQERSMYIENIYNKNLPTIEMHLDGQIRKVNGRFQQQFGYTFSDIAATNFASIVNTQHGMDVPKMIELTLEKRTLRRELLLCESNGLERWTISYWSMVSLKNDAYIIIQFALIHEIKRLNEESEKRIAEIKQSLKKNHTEPTTDDDKKNDTKL